MKNDIIIDNQAYRDNKNIQALVAPSAFLIGAFAFADCKNLEEVHLGWDITRISVGAFRGCSKLKHVWFLILDENKIIEIARNAFVGCSDITFHIFGTDAINNPSLNEYAKKHGFRVTGFSKREDA